MENLTNGCPYFNVDAFKNKTDEVCYIPDDSSDEFTYNDLLNEVLDFKNTNPDYFKFHKVSVIELLNDMFYSLSWEYPSTYLAGLE